MCWTSASRPTTLHLWLVVIDGIEVYILDIFSGGGGGGGGFLLHQIN